MLIYAFLLVLLLRPSWGLLAVFSFAAVALTAASGFFAGIDHLTVGIATLIQGVIFYGLGALIVFLRLHFSKKKPSSQDKQIDEELARIRAEAAAREGQQP